MEILSIDSLLKTKLFIPKYQRPYKWQPKNISDLLDDISNAIEDGKHYPDFKYRIGTIILNNVDGEMNIVDGQQRILSLLLIRLYLDPLFMCPLLDSVFFNKETQSNIHNNYMFIKDWFTLKSIEFKTSVINAFSKILEVVVLSVGVLSEAFQLFDSQNTRGKALDPHDLLKAYHLRAMRENPYEMRHAVTSWESVNAQEIRDLFDLYLFPVFKWSSKEKCHTFSAKDIDNYKGIAEDSCYTYARRAKKAMPYFQLTDAFIEGEDFFLMVTHYLNLLSDVKFEIEHNPNFSHLYEIITNKDNKSSGFSYAKNLFYCATLCYYDKFHNFDEQAVKKLFTWAFMLRVDMRNLGMDTVNKYAVGEWSDGYSNPEMPIFNIIEKARKHTEIANLQIKVLKDSHCDDNERWKLLYAFLLELNGIEGEVINEQ